MTDTHDTSSDYNFDPLAEHFQRKVYGGLKGDIRLAVLKRDLAPYLGSRQNIVDAGGGQGQFSIGLAEQGHSLTLCDISTKMLDTAKANAAAKNIQDMRFIHGPIQDLAQRLQQPADILLCHAVLEWMAAPSKALHHLSQCLKPQGLLSLIFFNIDSIIYKNLLRGNFRKVASGNYVGKKGGLTPINPLKSSEVLRWCEQENLSIVEHSGIRVFHDYIARPELRSHAPEALLEMELRFSREDPYRGLARYIHLIARKN